MKTQHSLKVESIQTRIFSAGEDLVPFIVEEVPASLVRNSMILAVTSKIVSLSERRLVSTKDHRKQSVVAAEADYNLGEIGYGCFLTIKHGLFIPSAGIDESNSQSGDYILYPLDPFESARQLWNQLREAWGIEKLGIIFTDSHTTPLRKGVTGISLAHWGFRGVKNMVGEKDLFGRSLQMTQVNLADGFAAAATLMMGEANECRPLAVVFAPEVVFCAETDPKEVKIPVRDDLYYPFFKNHL